jgi:TRAP transporter TAXI family solute receptor
VVFPSRNVAWFGVALMAGVAASPTGGFSTDLQAASQTVVRFLIGSPGAVDQRGFVEEYAKALPGVRIEMVETKGSGIRLEEIQHGEADLVINASDAVYLAFSGKLETTSERFDRLRAIAALGVVPMHLVARTGSGIRSVADLPHHIVSVGPPGGEGQRITPRILAAYGVDSAKMELRTLPSAEAAIELRAGRIDAIFVLGTYPAESVRVATTGDRAYVVPVAGPAADRLRAGSGFLHAALVPADTYPGQTVSIRTLGVQNVLVCRRDLDDQIVYELTKQFFVALPRLSLLFSSLRLIDVYHASATSIPLHDGAIRFYRERELLR